MPGVIIHLPPVLGSHSLLQSESFLKIRLLFQAIARQFKYSFFFSRIKIAANLLAVAVSPEECESSVSFISLLTQQFLFPQLRQATAGRDSRAIENV